MKTCVFLVIVWAIILSCGGSKKATTGNIANSAFSLPDSTGGSQLIAGSDCFTCHKKTEQFVAPSFQSITNRYDLTEKNIKMLTSKILKGGSGNWGEVPMVPHSGLSESDAQKIVVYILSQKNNQ